MEIKLYRRGYILYAPGLKGLLRATVDEGLIDQVIEFRDLFVIFLRFRQYRIRFIN